MPRRSDDSVRVGLYWMVRASRSSKLSKLSGPLMNSAMVDDFHDPLDPNPTRRWRIAAAPIGQTGYLAIVKVPVR